MYLAKNGRRGKNPPPSKLNLGRCVVLRWAERFSVTHCHTLGM